MMIGVVIFASSRELAHSQTVNAGHNVKYDSLINVGHTKVHGRQAVTGVVNNVTMASRYAPTVSASSDGPRRAIWICWASSYFGLDNVG